MHNTKVKKLVRYSVCGGALPDEIKGIDVEVDEVGNEVCLYDYIEWPSLGSRVADVILSKRKG